MSTSDFARRAAGATEQIRSLGIDRDRLLVALKRALPTAWFGTMVGATLVVMLLISFQPTTDADVFVAEYTLSNYLAILQQSQYVGVVVDTVQIAGLSALLALAIAYPAAYYVGVKLPERYQYPLVLGVIVPMWTLFIVRVYAWMTILGTNGTIHRLLMGLGLVGPEFTLLYTRAAVVVVLAQVWFPMAFLPVYSAMTGIDRTYFEAARDLGGTRWDAFRHVVFPLTAPAAMGGFLLVFLPSLGSYVTPLLIGGKNGFMIARVIASQFLSGYNWPFGAALAVVLTVMVLALTALSQRVIDVRETLRGVA